MSEWIGAMLSLGSSPCINHDTYGTFKLFLRHPFPLTTPTNATLAMSVYSKPYFAKNYFIHLQTFFQLEKSNPGEK